MEIHDTNICSTEHESHPVGTTVRVTKFFDYVPVRKQTALKNSSRCLAKIRRLMQAYALARPTIRFRLHILKAKNTHSDFVYAPKADANTEGAAMKVVGKDCALQCDWTAMQADGFEICAFLPKPTADGSKISGHGAFISVDGRPLSDSRGTIKQVVTAFKERLRKSNTSFAGIRDPFCCMSIICPPESYDLNIEPAKDDVLFENVEVVLGIADRLLTAYYPQAVGNVNDEEPPASVQQHLDLSSRTLQPPDETSITAQEHDIPSLNARPKSRVQPAQPRWRPTMYGIEEDDIEFLQESRALVIEQEEGVRAAELSNPWTIARMNTAIKSKPVADNGQLLSPAKNQNSITIRSSSLNPSFTSNTSSPARCLTPQISSGSNMARSPLDEELERSIQRISQPASQTDTFDYEREARPVERMGDNSSAPAYGNHLLNEPVPPANLQRINVLFPQSSPVLQGMPPQALSVRTKAQRKKPPYSNNPFAPSARQSNDAWSGQRFRGPQPPNPVGRQKHTQVSGRLSQMPSNTHKPVLDRTENQTYSDHHSDIRGFFALNRQPRDNEYTQDPSFPSVNSRDEQTAKEIYDYFSSHQQQTSSQPYISPPQSTQPKGHKYFTAERTKSSTKLPLERTPAGFHTNSLVLKLSLSVQSIIHSTVKLNMRRNIPEWGYAAKDAHMSVFEPVEETRVMGWVVRLDACLEGMYGRENGVDTRGVLHEGIQRGIHGRIGRGSRGSVDSPAVRDSDSPAVCSGVVGIGVKVGMSGGAEMVEGVERQSGELDSGVDDGGVVGEYNYDDDDDDVEDEMLMDL